MSNVPNTCGYVFYILYVCQNSLRFLALKDRSFALKCRCPFNNFYYSINGKWIKIIFEKDKTNNLFCLHAMQNHTRWTLNSSSSIVKHCQNMLNNNKLVWMRVYYGYIFGKRFTKKYKLNIIIVQEANLNLKRELLLTCTFGRLVRLLGI